MLKGSLFMLPIFQIWAGPFPEHNIKMIISCVNFACLCERLGWEYYFYCEESECEKFINFFIQHYPRVQTPSEPPLPVHFRVLSFQALDIKFSHTVSHQTLSDLVKRTVESINLYNTDSQFIKKIHHLKKEVYSLIALITHGGFFFDTSTSFLEEIFNIQNTSVEIKIDWPKVVQKFHTFVEKYNHSEHNHRPVYPFIGEILTIDVWFAYNPWVGSMLLKEALEKMSLLCLQKTLPELRRRKLDFKDDPTLFQAIVGTVVIMPIDSVFIRNNIISNLNLSLADLLDSDSYRLLYPDGDRQFQDGAKKSEAYIEWANSFLLGYQGFAISIDDLLTESNGRRYGIPPLMQKSDSSQHNVLISSPGYQKNLILFPDLPASTLPSPLSIPSPNPERIIPPVRVQALLQPSFEEEGYSGLWSPASSSESTHPVDEISIMEHLNVGKIHRHSWH